MPRRSRHLNLNPIPNPSPTPNPNRSPNRSPNPNPTQLKAEHEAEQRAYKLQNSAPKKLARLEAKVAEAEAEMEARGVQMLQAGADLGALAELDEAQRAKQAEVDGWYAEMLELEAELEQIASERAAAAKVAP